MNRILVSILFCCISCNRAAWLATAVTQVIFISIIYMIFIRYYSYRQQNATEVKEKRRDRQTVVAHINL